MKIKTILTTLHFLPHGDIAQPTMLSPHVSPVTQPLLVQLVAFMSQQKKAIILSSYAVLALLVVMDALPFIVNKEHAHTAIEHIPGFWALFGFAACTLIIFLSKWYGHAGIMQREDYYNE